MAFRIFNGGEESYRGGLPVNCPSCFGGDFDQVRCHYCAYEPLMPHAGIALPIGTLLKNGEYQVGRILGKPGGFGITYLGWNLQLETKVAIKEYLPLQIAGRGAGTATVSVHAQDNIESFECGLKSFLDEARTLAQLRHDNIVRVQNFFRENGTAYMVMEFLEGQSLEEYLVKVGRITAPDAVALFLPILDGLAYLHQKNILHRDIKPANIYLTEEGKAILLDFGAARQAMQERSQSMTSIVTPGFAPWEQYYRKGRQGPWTDVYACAATLYRMVTGQVPQDGAERAIEDDMVQAENLVAGLDISISNAIMAGLAIKIENRPQTASEFAILLQEDNDHLVAAGNRNQGSRDSEETHPSIAQKSIVGDVLQNQENSNDAQRVKGKKALMSTTVFKMAAILLLAMVLGGLAISEIMHGEIGKQSLKKQSESIPVEAPQAKPIERPQTIEPVKWTANSVWPHDNYHSVALVEVSKRAKDITKGTVEMTVQVGGARGYRGSDLLKVVRDGQVHVSDMLMGGVTSDEPLFNIVNLPFLFQSLDECKILMDIARPHFEKVAAQKWGQKILYSAPWPATGLWSKKEIRSVADMRGIKTRIFSKYGEVFVRAVQGNPHPLPSSQLNTSLKEGLIDSVLTSTPTVVDLSLSGSVRFFAPIYFAIGTNIVTVNLKEFNKLDIDTREALIKLGKDMEEEMWEKVDRIDKENERICNRNGIKTILPTPEFLNELSLVTRGIREDWLRTAPSEARLIVQEFNRRVGRR